MIKKRKTKAYVDHVFVVEMLVEEPMRKPYWGPCNEISLTFADSAKGISRWKLRNPISQFRVSKYVRAK